MPMIFVGDAPMPATWQEYYVATMPNNTPIRFDIPGMIGTRERIKGVGVLLFSTWYDGVCASIATLDGKSLTAFADKSKIRRLTRCRRGTRVGKR